MYKVFKRKPYRKERGQYIPNPGARCYTIGYANTISEAREMCANGPANQALDEGREYRHLSFYEFTSE